MRELPPCSWGTKPAKIAVHQALHGLLLLPVVRAENEDWMAASGGSWCRCSGGFVNCILWRIKIITYGATHVAQLEVNSKVYEFGYDHETRASIHLHRKAAQHLYCKAHDHVVKLHHSARATFLINVHRCGVQRMA